MMGFKRLLFIFFFFLILRPAESLDPGVQFFLSILNKIRSETLFHVDETAWLVRSLGSLFPGQPSAPVSLDQYTRILESHMVGFSPAEKNRLLTRAIRSLLDGLPDPYAAFLSPEEVEEESRSHRGDTFTGFGLELAERQGGVIVAGFLPASPASRAGLLPGDRLIEVNGDVIDHLKNAFANLKPGRIRLLVRRNRQTFSVEMTSGPIRLIPFFAKRYGRTGYIKMQVILPGSDARFLDAAVRFRDGGANLLVLDLRDCLGGDVKTARRIAGFFLKPRDLVYVKESRGAREPFLNHDTTRIRIPLVILVDGATASAAELISGALQDHHAATLYGARTLGKGYIETTWTLQGGWALRFTTARYLLPAGESVQGEGVPPDVACSGLPSRFSCPRGEFHTRLETLFRLIRN